MIWQEREKISTNIFSKDILTNAFAKLDMWVSNVKNVTPIPAAKMDTAETLGSVSVLR
jgi:hypothetical protein